MIVEERFELPRSRYVDIPNKYPYGFGFGGFGEAVYYDTYSRNDMGAQERWIDTGVRNINGLFSIRKDWYRKMGLRWRDEDWYDYAEAMLTYEYTMRWLPPGRGLWALGSEHVYEVGSMALNNCAFTEINSDSWIQDLGWSMDALMCGCGVGYRLNAAPGSVRKQLKPRRMNSRVCTIGDSREGWVESVELLLRSFQEGEHIEFDYHQIRPYGSPLRRFGGVSSGPAPLIVAHRRIVASTHNFMSGRISQTRYLADLVNAVGQCVISGNVRRGAQIIIGDLGDQDFLDLKNPAVHGTPEYVKKARYLYNLHSEVFEISTQPGEEYNYSGVLKYLEEYDLSDEDYISERLNISGLSNNSVALETSEDFLGLPVIADGIRNNGEPGFLNLINIGKFGRYGTDVGSLLAGTVLREDFARGCNPCGEIELEDKELCNLAELFPTQCDTPEEFRNAVRMATFYAQTVSLLQTHRPETNAIVSRNRRIGVSISGCADWLDNVGASRMTRMLRDSYQIVVSSAAEFARAAGVPAPVRHTTIKPSGTVSQLAGVSAGMHFPTFPFAIRRKRVGANTPMAELLQSAGYPSEPDLHTPNTLVFEFPINQGTTRHATAVSMWEQIAFKAMLEREWADNMVSCTAYFNPTTEAGQIEHALGQFAPLVKSMSMLPHTEEGAYEQMPYQGISELEYERRVRGIKPIDWSMYSGKPTNSQAVLYCENDHCEVVGG